MAVQAYSTGDLTVTATGIEYTLALASSSGLYTLHFSATALTTGDVLEGRVYQAMAVGSVPAQVFYGAWYGVQPAHDMIKVSLPIGNDNNDASALKFTLTQTAGATGRVYPWKLLRYY